MYKEPCIREILKKQLNSERASVDEVLQTITDFVQKLENKEIVRGVFQTEEFLCMHRIIPTLTRANEKTIDELLAILKKVGTSKQLSEDKRKDFVFTFARLFAECSDDPYYCDNKIYILIKNLSENSGIDIVKEYDSWEDAEKDIDDIYVGCCDDAYMAENMWFTILCWCQEHQWDIAKNFCTIVEFDATGLEKGRQYWEENCENDADSK